MPLVRLATGAALALFALTTTLAAQEDDERVSSASGARVTLGGFLQADGRLIAGDARASGVLLRRARLVIDASGERGFRLRLQPDFGQGRVLIQDAYVGWRDAERDVRVGRFRPVFGGERTRSSATLLFPERGLLNTLMPARSTGAQLILGSAQTGLVLGVFRTPLGDDAQTIDTDGDLEQAPAPTDEGLVRVQGALGPLDAGRGLTWHLSVMAGTARGRRTDAFGPARLLTVGQRPIFTYDADTADPVVADGRRLRGAAGLEYVSRRHAAHVEVVGAEDGVRRQNFTRVGLRHGGAGAAWSFVWNGTRSADYSITPTAGRTAVEVGARLGAVWVDRAAIDRFAAPGSALRAWGGGVAISWLPTAATRLSLSYDTTLRDRGPNAREHAVFVRVQQGF